ncbi:MAG TPA: MerR family transcriptional regulator [Blastocatellia bacterium]|nr:MerR family transcriptional regulator [Blastocatellia bacterium]
MPELSISEVAQRMGLRASAIRYYEQIGVLPRARRVSGRRRYDQTTLERLAVIQRARQAGFSLDEIRQLFFGFARTTRPSERWEKLAQRKLAELEALTQEIESMRTLLQESCGCEALDECGKRLLHHKC